MVRPGLATFPKAIAGVCVFLYLLALALDLSGIQRSGGLFDLLAPSFKSLYKLGMGGLEPWQAGRWWTPLTATYLHGGIFHILFNLLWLRQIAPLVERLFGQARFVVIYTIAGLSGSFVSILAGTNYFVGASGAIFGLFGALIYYGRFRGGAYGTSIFRQMLVWAALGFVFGLANRGVDNWGHLGGFLGGFFAALFLGYQERSPQSSLHKTLEYLALSLFGVCYLMVFIIFFQ